MSSEGEHQALGSADELGIAVLEGVDPADVTIYDDGTHSGPPRFEETDKKFTGLAGMNHYYSAMSCPCGHFIRYVTYSDRPEFRTVTCEGPTMTVERLADELGLASEVTEQTTLIPATDGGKAQCVGTGRDPDA